MLLPVNNLRLALSLGPRPQQPVTITDSGCFLSYFPAMMFPFFNRLQVKKITVAGTDETAKKAQQMLEGLLQDLPDLLMACVVDIASGKVLASYTTHATLNPNHISLRYAKVVRSIGEALDSGAWVGGPLTDISLILEDQLHHLRPLHAGQWYCFVAVRTADANLAIAKEVMRRHTD
jgi:hypothetical protein